MEERAFSHVTGIKKSFEDDIDPIQTQTCNRSDDKKERKWFLMDFSISFEVFELHFSWLAKQLFQRKSKPLIKMREEMKYFMKKIGKCYPFQMQRLTAVAAIFSSSCCVACLTNHLATTVHILQ